MNGGKFNLTPFVSTSMKQVIFCCMKILFKTKELGPFVSLTNILLETTVL